MLTRHPRPCSSPRLERTPTAPAHRHRRWSRALLAALLAVVLGLLAADSTAAATGVLAQAPGPSITDVLNNARNWIMGILAVLATLLFTIGGLRYLMAGGSAGEVEKAKQAFKSAGIGYALVVLAPVVVEILKSILAQP
ncbi:pilin [Saccharopolyspora sp. NPDC002376]